MTKLEREILKILTDDARHTPKEIAVMLGVEEQKHYSEIYRYY